MNPKSGHGSFTPTDTCRRHGTGPEITVRKCTFGEAKRFAEFAEHARKKGHNVDDIVARRIACEDLAAALRGRR